MNAEALVSSGYYGHGARRYEGSLIRTLAAHPTFPAIAEVKLAFFAGARPHGPRKLIDDYVRRCGLSPVLTEPHFFHGSLKNLELGRQSGPCS